MRWTRSRSGRTRRCTAGQRFRPSQMYAAVPFGVRSRRDSHVPAIAAGPVHGGGEAHDDGSNAPLDQAQRMSGISRAGTCCRPWPTACRRWSSPVCQRRAAGRVLRGRCRALERLRIRRRCGWDLGRRRFVVRGCIARQFMEPGMAAVLGWVGDREWSAPPASPTKASCRAAHVSADLLADRRARSRSSASARCCVTPVGVRVGLLSPHASVPRLGCRGLVCRWDPSAWLGPCRRALKKPNAAQACRRN